LLSQTLFFAVALAFANAPVPNDSRALAIAYPQCFGIFHSKKTKMGWFGRRCCEQLSPNVAFQRQKREKTCAHKVEAF
jgi:hypothetical protein